MTDKKIIKALQYIVENGSGACDKCPVFPCGKIKDYEDNQCGRFIAEKALDLINRQQSEIERLQKEVNLVSIQFQDVQERQEESQAEIKRLEEESLILKQFINGEWVDCKEIQEALSIDFATGLKRFDFSRTAEWCPAPLCGQKITSKFRLSDNKAIKEFAEKLKNAWSDNRYDSPDIDFDYFVDLVQEMVGENNG